MKKTLSVFRFLGMFLFMAAVATAADSAAAAVAPVISVGEAPWWKGLLNGFVAGVIAVFYGYAKNKDPKTGEMEGFDIKYAFPTLIVGGLIGIIGYFLKMTPQDLGSALTTSPIYGAIVFAAEAVLKALFRHSVPWIRDAIDKLKAAPKENPTASPEDKPPKP